MPHVKGFIILRGFFNYLIDDVDVICRRVSFSKASLFPRLLEIQAVAHAVKYYLGQQLVHNREEADGPVILKLFPSSLIVKEQRLASSKALNELHSLFLK